MSRSVVSARVAADDDDDDTREPSMTTTTATANSANTRGIVRFDLSQTFTKTTPQGLKQQEQAHAFVLAKGVQHEKYVPMLIFNEEVPSTTEPGKTWHRHRAYEILTFLNHIGTGRPRSAVSGAYLMSFNEIVVGPCKFFVDLDVKFHDAKSRAISLEKLGVASIDEIPARCNELARQLLRGFVETLRALSGRPQLSPRDFIVTTAHKPGAKWSMHITLDGSTLGRELANNDDDGDAAAAAGANDSVAQHLASVVLATPGDSMAVIATVIHALRTEDHAGLWHMVDEGVYTVNHPMRTYWSSKALEPERRLLTVDEPRATTMMPNMTTMLRSLITCIIVPRNSGELQLHGQPSPAYAPHHWLLSSHLLTNVGDALDVDVPLLRCELDPNVPISGRARSVKMPASTRQTGTRYSTASVHLDALVHSAEFAAYEPYAMLAPQLSEEGDLYLVVSCRGVRCETAPDGVHSDNTHGVYIVCDLLRGQWFQKCHAGRCVERRARRGPDGVFPRTQPLSPTQASYVSAYLKEDWPLGSAIGTQLAHALGIAS